MSVCRLVRQAQNYCRRRKRAGGRLRKHDVTKHNVEALVVEYVLRRCKNNIAGVRLSDVVFANAEQQSPELKCGDTLRHKASTLTIEPQCKQHLWAPSVYKTNEK